MIFSAHSCLRFKIRSLLLAVFLIITTAGTPLPRSVLAATQSPSNSYGTGLMVNTFSDDPEATNCMGTARDNLCSLRGAITVANRLSGVVVIYLQAGTYYLFGEANDDKNIGGDLDINKNGGSITISAPDLSVTRIDAQFQDRIFDVHDTSYPAALYLKNITLLNGNSSEFADGGTIRSYGSVYLNLVEIRDSYGRNGGAIYIRSSYYQTLTINQSTIANSSAAHDGGAIYADNEVTTISNSTFDHNTATGVLGSFYNNENSGRGGAIYNKGYLTVNSSTFANNTARLFGGGIFNYAFMGERVSARINSSTFQSNSAALANQARAFGNPQTSAVMTISNSILSSTVGNCINKSEPKGYAVLLDGGNNLDSGFTCPLNAARESKSGVNARLGALGNYGGPTATIQLKADSPAIDRGNPYTCSMRDQRGLFAEARCDIGAFEANASPWLIPTVSGTKTEQRLHVTVKNQVGNPLVGWNVDFQIPDGAPDLLSSYSAQTNSNGLASINADPTRLSGTTFRIAARSGGGTAWFQGSAAGFFPDYQNGLPNTGFIPGINTYVPRQLNQNKTRSVGDITLEIPALEKNIPVVGVPKDGQGWDVTWLSSQAGYLEGTAFPSFRGNSVLTAHVALADGTPGPFANIINLKWGDLIHLRAYGIKYSYEVRNVEIVQPDDKSVLAHKDEPWITLLTCHSFDPSSQTYQKRLAVSAVLVRQE
jgi:LPXTG-site transpeptidase (sortase) family protein